MGLSRRAQALRCAAGGAIAYYIYGYRNLIPGTIAAPLAAIVAGLIIGLVGFVQCGEALRGMLDFEQTTGRVVRSEVLTRTEGRNRGRFERVVHYARIDVAYEVNDRPYGTARLTWSHPRAPITAFQRHRGYWWSDSATQATEAFPMGATVPVYYNPYDPSVAVVDRSVSPRSVLAFLLGSALFMGGIVLGLWVNAPTPRSRRSLDEVG